MWAFILPQFLYLDKIQSRDYIFKYETLNDCAEFIQNRLGYTVDTSVKQALGDACSTWLMRKAYHGELQEVGH